MEKLRGLFGGRFGGRKEPISSKEDKTGKATSASGEAPSFGWPDSPFVSSYTPKDYLDEEGLEKEIINGAHTLQAANDELTDLLQPHLKIILRSPGDRYETEYLQWQKSQAKTWGIVEFLAGLEAGFKETLDKSKTGGKPPTMTDFQIYHSLHVGGEILIREEVERQLRYAQRYGFTDRLRPYLQLQEFTLTGGELALRVNGVALRDFLESDPKLRPPLSSLYKFLVESHVVRYRCSHDKVAGANQEYPRDLYPNRNKQAVEGATAKVMALVGIVPQTMDDLVVRGGGMVKEAAWRAQRLHKRVHDIRQSFYQTLLNPASLDFPSVREAIILYLDREKYERVLALHVAGLCETSQINQLYRRARELTRGSSEARFYARLARSIKEYAELLPQVANVLTIDDLPTVFDEEGTSDGIASELEELGQIVNAVFARSSTKKYSLNPQEVNWGRLIPPQKVRVELNPNRPQKFTIALSYENEVGESLNLGLGFDIKRKEFEWNFIEAPSDPRMGGFREAALAASRSTLTLICTKVKEEYAERQRLRAVKPQIAPAKRPKERASDEIYALRKEVRAEARRQVDTGGNALPDLASIAREEKVKSIILLPKEEVWEKMLGRLASTDRPIAKEGIGRFNQDGVGEFKRKRGKSREGEILYALRINCSVPGGMRVLAHEVSSTNGVRNFEIRDIRYRKDIYREAGI